MNNRGRITFEYLENKIRNIALFERIILYAEPVCGKIFDILSVLRWCELCIVCIEK